MTDYFGGRTKDDLEQLARRLIDQGAEGRKVDFKQMLTVDSPAEKAEFAKDVSSIANTDDNAHLDDWGYLIFGASGGKLVGHVKMLEGDPDRLQAQLTEKLKGFLAPVPSFSLVAFDDKDVGRWGMIVIPPSAQQPHIFIRDGKDVVKHEWWVRVNDTKETASVLDYARVLGKAARREVAPLERQVQRLSLLVEHRSPSPAIEDLLAVVRGKDGENSSPPSAEDIAGRIRSHLLRGKHRLEDDLIAEALRVTDVAFTTSDRNPAVFSGKSREEVVDVLSYLEEATFPLAMAFANIARYDSAGELTGALCRAVRIMAKVPQPIGHHYTAISQFRLYPLVLCLYAIFIVASNEGRGDLLQSVLALSVNDERRDRTDPLILCFRKHREALDVFRVAFEKQYFEPVAVRVEEVLVPRLSGLLAGTATTQAFSVAEFVLALAYLKVSDGYFHGKLPLPGSYLYKSEAGVVLRKFLGQQPEWLEEALGQPVTSLLQDFDATAQKVVQNGGWGDGFTSGAVSAFEGSQ